METRGIWPPVPPDLLSWLHFLPVQALPSPGTFRETLGCLHLFVLCCLKSILYLCLWQTQIIQPEQSCWYHVDTLPFTLVLGGVTSPHGHVLKWAGFERTVTQNLLTVLLPTVLFAINVALMSALCLSWFKKTCWIVPLLHEQKNGIWVFSFHYCHSA